MLNSMARLRAKRARGDDGFTLIELLVVVVIIGILIAIAIPLYLNYRRGANDKAAQSDLRNAVSVLEICNSDNGGYPTTAQTAVSGTNGQPGSYAPCTNQKVNLSGGTQLSYSGTATSYSAVTTNTGGSSKYYCYNSANGGSVIDISGKAGVTSLASALTNC